MRSVPVPSHRQVKRQAVADTVKADETAPADYAAEWLVKRFRVSPLMAAALAHRPASGGRFDEANISDQSAAVADDRAAGATGSEPDDPIADLIARLAAAADTGCAAVAGRRARVTVRRVPTGFAIERGDRR